MRPQAAERKAKGQEEAAAARYKALEDSSTRLYQTAQAEAAQRSRRALALAVTTQLAQVCKSWIPGCTIFDPRVKKFLIHSRRV